MKVQLEHILQNLFHKPSLEEVNVRELEQMVKEHPYFSTGHFLLAQKLKQENTAQGDQQSQKAALYFHDPLWLQWQLKELSNGHEEIVVEEEPLQPEEQLAIETVGPVEEAIPAEPVTEIETEEPIEQDPAVEEPIVEETFEPEPEPETIESEPEPIDYNSPADEVQSFHETQPEPAPAPPVAEEPKPSEPSQPVIQKEEESPLVFEAYHTIDYFASQGIKASAEVQPGDKLGKQLKSFTEWLKTMRRLPQVQAEAITDESEQQHIRQSAADSLEQKEVVTETMAEVLVKQGKNLEAIAIYEKLSLLDPSKSAFFAAKIETLKAN